MDALFSPESRGGGRLLALALVSALLLVAEARTGWLTSTRAVLGTVVAPLDYAAGVPLALGRGGALALRSRADLVRRVANLERENALLAGRSSRYQAILDENDRLRALFESNPRSRSSAVAAQLIGESIEPREVVIDKGRRDGVRLGAPVVDAYGLFGQVIEALPFSARVLLVTDPSHAVPVHASRNNVRAIAAGIGPDSLALTHAPITLDIREGDLLVTSGLGGRFPGGYPVGTVKSVVRDATETFASIVVKPQAALDRSRHLLVLLQEAGALGDAHSAEQSD